MALGFIKWDEYHKYIVITIFIVLVFRLYVVVHRFQKYLQPRYYNHELWTVRRECCVFLCWIPTTAVTTCFLAGISIPEFELNLASFTELQFYNFMLSFVSIPPFTYFIDRKFNSLPTDESLKQPEPKTKPNQPEVEAHKILQTLHELMENEKPYLSNKCSLQQVSNSSGISVHQISSVINSFTEYSFNDFVNKYRVEHACRILQNGPDKNLTLEALGYECGFGSKASFYAAFRKFTGTTPAVYLKQSDALTKENI